jgi:porin
MARRKQPAARRRRKAALLAASLSLPAGLPAAAQEGCEEGTPLAEGLCLATEATIDLFGNLRGGRRRGVAATGQLRLGLEGDLGRMAGLEGWRFRVSAFGIYGRQPGPTLAGSLTAPSNVEALSTFRLNEAWLQRDFGDWGSIRIGQIAVDTEFATVDSAGLLVNSVFGWPLLHADTLPAGGPVYPFAAPGLRLALGDPEAGTGLRFGIFAGNPAGRPGEDTNPQAHNRYGTTFSFAGGAFMIAEAVTGAEGATGGPRPWVAKLGGWYHTGGFDAQRRDAEGLSLADPASSGVPRRYGNNYGGYAIGEATLWRDGEGENETSIVVFTRLLGTPSDRNRIVAQLDAGLAWRNPFGRPRDTLSIGIGHTRVGTEARRLDRDLQAFGEIRPRRSGETVLEVNYDVAVVPGRLSVRPMVQWIINPGAGEPDERVSTTQSLDDAVLLGLRVTATF